jgi:hypothetical protein
MGYAIGFISWQFRRTWEGYICNLCAFDVTAQSLLRGSVSFFLIHPQAVIWAPFWFGCNLWTAALGSSPEPPMGFLERDDIVAGRVSEPAAQRIAALAREVLAAAPYHPTGAYLGVAAVSAGVKEKAFVRQVVDAINGCTERKRVSRWFPLAAEWESTILAES